MTTYVAYQIGMWMVVTGLVGFTAGWLAKGRWRGLEKRKEEAEAAPAHIRDDFGGVQLAS